MFIVVLFLIVKHLEQPECPVIGDGLFKLGPISKTENHEKQFRKYLIIWEDVHNILNGKADSQTGW